MPAMIRLLAYLLTILITTGIASAQSRQFIAVEAASDSDNSSGAEFNGTLAEAFTNYLEYYLFRTGRSEQTTIIGPGLAAARLDSLKSDTATDNLVHLTISGRLKTGHSFYTDRRRQGHFVTRPNCLEVRINFGRFTRENGRLVRKKSGNLKEEARAHWLPLNFGEDAHRIDSLVAVTAEPQEYILRRAVERLFDSEEPEVTPVIANEQSIPVVVLVDSSYVSEVGERWRAEVEALIASGTFFLSRDFGLSLDLKRVESGVHISPTVRTAAERFTGFRKLIRPSGDTLFIGLYSRSDIEDFIGQRETDAIGLSVTGERVMLLRQIPQAGRGDDIWRAQLNALVLVHELAHVLGAIHVSDPWSIMCHNATWLAPSRFDSFNAVLVAAALRGDFQPGENTNYLAFLSRLLSDSPYRLVDFPPVLYRCLNRTNLLADPKVAIKTVGQPLFAAAQGYGKLLEGNRRAAAELFVEAAGEGAKQACLPYYLAQVTSGPNSIAAMRRAAEMGYWQAQLLLRRLSSQASNR